MQCRERKAFQMGGKRKDVKRRRGRGKVNGVIRMIEWEEGNGSKKF